MIWLIAHGVQNGWLPIQMTPIHPILVNFTAALVPTSFAADLLGRWFGKRSLSSTGWWTLMAATLITPLTVAAGWYWKLQSDMSGMDTRQMAVHQWLGSGLAVLFVGLAIWRGQLFRRDRIPGFGYLSVLAILVGLLTLQGHLGGVMSFGDDDTVADGGHLEARRAGTTSTSTSQTSPTTAPTASHHGMATATRAAAAGLQGVTTFPAAAPSVPSAAKPVDAGGWADHIPVIGPQHE